MLELGPDLFRLLNARQRVGNREAVIYGAEGLSRSEIVAIETELGFRLPEDFAYLLRNMRDPGGVFFSWADFERKRYQEMIAWVLRGIEFDIEYNNEWLDRWGKRPANLSEALEIARKDFATWPKLLPVYGHRFLGAEPCRVGNPVFSIVQTDIVYYGSNLAHYLLNEFVEQDLSHRRPEDIQRIDIWSDYAEERQPPPGVLRRS
jgi:hypothetical protein